MRKKICTLEVDDDGIVWATWTSPKGKTLGYFFDPSTTLEDLLSELPGQIEKQNMRETLGVAQ
jgi:hypothetical protein